MAHIGTWATTRYPVEAVAYVPEATLSAAMELPEVPTDAQLHDACLSYRHDYGLMDLVSREKLQWECREWWRCVSRALAAIKEPKT